MEFLGYTFLAIALFCGVTKGYCGKKSSGTITYASDALLVNTLRMTLCILIGFIIIAVLTKLNVKGAVLLGIFATTVIYYLATWQLPSFDMSSVIFNSS